MKRFIVIYGLVFFFLFCPKISLAESSYVLPYPSSMPGSIFYKVHKIWENIAEYWYFGNLNKFTYNIQESDKYLVEAKTLFEYKQYLLAYSALEKSNIYFKKVPIFLERARKENKDVTQKKKLLENAALKHIEVLNKIKAEIPISVLWQPENTDESTLYLHNLIDQSIVSRNVYL